MALKPATVGIVLAIALTILTAMASATPNWSPIFGPQLPLRTRRKIVFGPMLPRPV